ncbi:MAG: cation:proton antiporter [Hyphomonadaceae bacterium BRH_c29]|jgi:multicomponent Na+:H+ antiporter subunit B|nr:MAG: cation:proton antiporter [Hyphomonadaceae bacterium BRH_c29]
MHAMFNGDFGVILVNIFLLGILFAVAIAIARMRSLFAIVMLSGMYSLVSAAWYVAIDAVDVAFTEAAVGAGMSTVVLLGAMLLTSRTAKPEKFFFRLGPLLVCLATGAALIYATVDLPALGDATSAANAGVGYTYLQVGWFDTGIPNIVTPVLASYRGFDTLGETTVVFVAGLAVALLLGFGERSLAERIRNEGRTSNRGSKKAPAVSDEDPA